MMISGPFISIMKREKKLMIYACYCMELDLILNNDALALLGLMRCNAPFFSWPSLVVSFCIIWRLTLHISKGTRVID